MLSQVGINRCVGNGKYADVLDVAEALADAEYGSAANAVVVMVRRSPLFRETLRKLRNGARSSTAREPAAKRRAC